MIYWASPEVNTEKLQGISSLISHCSFIWHRGTYQVNTNQQITCGVGMSGYICIRCHLALTGNGFTLLYGPLAEYVTSWVAHAPGIPGTLSPPTRVSVPDMHHGTCSLGSRWWGKRSRHSRRMRNLHFYVSGKRPKAQVVGAPPHT